jgi:hypothetical protein
VRAFVSFLISLSLLLASPALHADHKPAVVVEARGGWTVIGVRNSITGFTPGLSATYLWAPSEHVRLGLGVDFAVILGGGPRWTGMLGGPTARVEFKPSTAPFVAGLSVSSGIGRAPVCTPWPDPICPRFVGLFPAATLSGAYLAESGLLFGASFGARWFHTMIGDTASFEPSAFVGANFGGK